jgi:hypothetical protein
MGLKRSTTHALRLLVLAFLVGATGAILPPPAFAETCEQVAQRAWEQAFRQCQDNQPECRSDRDCAVGSRCDRGRCVQAPDPVTCIPNCTERRSTDGSCRTYGRDFCGRTPTCIENCIERRSTDGTCRNYGADHCSDEPISCAMNCTDRRSDGTCRTWGRDFCGPWAECRPNCIERRSDGTCRTFGSDVCQ